MSRYIVTPILSPRNIPYYVVTDTSTSKGVEGYGCETWARHYGEYTELIADAAPPINGYCLTKKGFETVEWKQVYKQWEKSMEEWANG